MDRERIDQLIAECAETLRSHGLRRTRALDLVIGELAKSDRPLKIGELANAPALKNQCDPATIYRLLIKLQEHGMVRRLGLHERSSHYALVVADEHHDYLVCTECGTIEDIDMSCPVGRLEKDLMERSGYTGVYHELEFFGVCPQCDGAA
jgi:Fur family ferric uptake transcriptional regulator